MLENMSSKGSAVLLVVACCFLLLVTLCCLLLFFLVRTILQLCTDGDCQLASELAKFNVEQLRDIAHIKKNVVKQLGSIIKACNFKGDAYKGKDTKIGKENFASLCNGVKTAIKQCADKGQAENWGKAEMSQHMNRVIDHFAGKTNFTHNL